MRHIAVFVLTLLASQIACGQDRANDEAIAATLATVRHDLLTERKNGGIALLSSGAVSLLGGLAVAAIGHDDPFWLSLGLGSAGWGAINGALSVPLFDLGGTRADEIEDGSSLRGAALAKEREEVIRRQHGSATFFALNFGLDVAYIGTAVLMFLLADQLAAPDDDHLRGYSVAQMVQGGFLLVFDFIEWMAAEAAAERVANIPLPL